MSNPHIILLSGELRVFDMPVKREVSGASGHAIMKMNQDAEDEAINNAIKVENPELIDNIDRMIDSGIWIKIDETGNDYEPMKDGDQFPLPKGLKVEIVEEINTPDGWKNVNCFFGLDRKSGEFRQIARLIKEPVKELPPKNDGSLCGLFPRVSEPSESQEEIPAVPWRIEVKPKGWGPSTVMFDANDNCVMYEHSPNIIIWTIIVDAVNQKYTRK